MTEAELSPHEHQPATDQRRKDQSAPHLDPIHGPDAAPPAEIEPGALAGPTGYFASLGDYNHMVLHGAWVDDLTDPEQVHQQVQFMLGESEEAVAEEYALHDYDGFGAWSPHEYETIENIARVAAGIVEHGLAFAAWVSYLGHPASEHVDDFADVYQGEWESLEAYTEDLIGSCAGDVMDAVPEWIANYLTVDLEKFGRDLARDLHVAPSTCGGVWVFDPHV